MKWRRLLHLDMLLIDRVSDVIVTACCFHNFIIQFNERNHIGLHADGSSSEDESGADSDLDINNEWDRDAQTGADKRNAIKVLLNC